MHGRVKTRTTAEQQAIKKIEREKKVILYKTGLDRVFKKRQSCELDEEMLELTAQLLTSNPDIYTLWNIRRQTLLHLKNERSSGVYQELMEIELRLTETCLRVNPKSYGGWHQRSWVLDNMPEANWARELSLCDKYLNMDERNFHTWNYRKFVAQRANVPASKEFDYTTQKISTNFSNYSSWHYRSKLLPLLYPDPSNKLPLCEDKHKEELELVHNAAFTDPNDQSAWFYQRWLLGRLKQPLEISNALLTPDISFVAFNVTSSISDLQIIIKISGIPIAGSWSSSNGNSNSHLWVFTADTNIWEQNLRMAEVSVHVHCNGEEVCVMLLKTDRNIAWGLKTAKFVAEFSKDLKSCLEKELKSCQQLLELEPDSKWTLLTSVLLMQAIDRKKFQQETMKILNQLIKEDKLRIGYYEDLRSRYVVEYAIEVLQESSTDAMKYDIDLSSHNLTALYHSHCFSLLQKVNLSNNRLTHSLQKLHPLQNCQILILDNNGIESLQMMPTLPQLQELSLNDNNIKNVDELYYLKSCTKLSSLHLSGNPIESENGLIKCKNIISFKIYINCT